MSVFGLQALLTTAVTDQALCTALLHGDAAAYAPFDLSAAETADLRTISATTLEEYALQAHWLFYGEDLRLSAALPGALHPTPLRSERTGLCGCCCE